MPTLLSGNALKILAAITMFLDHAGMLLFPGNRMLRIIGRLAFPIYAYMIAEGCKYTRSRVRYFLSLFLLGALCQIVYFAVDGSLYFSILITFSMSILTIYALDAFKAKPGALSGAVLIATLGTVYALNRVFTIDYGFLGCMVPVLVSLPQGTKYDSKAASLTLLALGLTLLAVELGAPQQYALLALLPLALYSGKRGKWRMKYFFYIFYPAHLVLLQAITWLRA